MSDAATTRRSAGDVLRGIGRSFGLTSTRRTAILAIVLCAITLSVAVPLRNYLSVQSDLDSTAAEHRELSDKVAELERRKAVLDDPEEVEAQARERLRFVRPGETPYIVQLPGGLPGALAGAPQPGAVEVAPWYSQLWSSLNAGAPNDDGGP